MLDERRNWRRWLTGGIAPRWYLVIVPLALGGFVVANREGFLESPLWIPVALLVAAVPLRMVAFSWWGRDCTDRQLHYRSALQAGLVTAVIFSTGWGPMLALGYLIVAQEGVWASGARAAVPGTVWALIALAVGQTLLGLGVAPSAVDATAAHTIAALAATGTVFGVYLVHATAEEREAALDAEQRARRYLSTVLAQVPDSITIVNGDGTIRYVSDRAHQLFGRMPEELVGRAGLDLVVPEDRAAVEEMFAELFSQRDAIDGVEIRVEDAGGGERWVQVTARNLLHVPEINGVVATVRDVSDRKQVEQERAALERAREHFMAMAAHELRTPLTTVVGAAGLIERHGPDSEEGHEAVVLIRRQGRRLSALVEQLLDLSALDAGGVTLDPRPVALSALVDSILGGTPAPSHVSVERRISDELMVTADAGRLEQILTNLLTNAYAHGGPNVAIDALVDSDTVAISVADDGPGVPDELATTIFEPFARGPRGGTGLGLAICHRLARAHRGSLTYEANTPRGSRFVLALPHASRRRTFHRHHSAL